MSLDNHHAASDYLVLHVAVAVLHVEDVLERLQKRLVEVKVWQLRLLNEERRDDLLDVLDGAL